MSNTGSSIIKVRGLNESDKCKENGGKDRLIGELVMEWERLVR